MHGLTSEQVTLIISFLAGLLWFRLLFIVAPTYFNKPFTRTKTRLNWHHLHFGIVLVLIGNLLLLAKGESPLVTGFLGVGSGLIVDLFIPSLILKTDRREELVIYRNSLKATLVLAAFITTLAIILSVSTS